VKLLISGICGFVGSSLAAGLRAADSTLEICGFDNFIRPGSETNRLHLRALGIEVTHADGRSTSDMAALPTADWVLDAAALPSVLAGIDGRSSSRQLVEHNLGGTINLLEYCRERRAGLVLLSTSRVYSIAPLRALSLQVKRGAFTPDLTKEMPAGMTENGVGETFSTTPPLSLYGSTKAASEMLALEYGAAFEFPVWINRCGVLAGAGQFGQAEQGIFSYWIHTWAAKKPLRYIGHGGTGAQTRDALHPRDLVPLLQAQMAAGMPNGRPQVLNAAGGTANSMSLAQLSAWCGERFHRQEVAADPKPRTFDVPWLVLDSARAANTWNWRPSTPLLGILDEIADHAMEHPEWLTLSRP
jgi:CDP-paratose 2-epimerase